MDTLPLATHLHLEPSPTLHINERVNSLWEAGETVYHFGFGESRFPVHPRLVEALQANAGRKAYPPVQGIPALRRAIAAYYGRVLDLELSAEQVLVGPGSKSLLFALQMAFDADLLLPTPSWVSYAPQARLLGKRVHSIAASPADNYALCLDAVADAAAAAGDRPKMLIINSPNNPTGQMLSAEFLRRLAELCRREKVIVISDEIYGLVPHAEQAHVTLAHFYPEGTVVVSGLSKHLSLGGWRLGHAIIPPERPGLMWALKSIASELWSSASAPIQYAAVVAYGGEPEVEAYIHECAQIHGVRTHHVWSWLVELGVSVARPQGGFYMMPNFDRWREPLARVGVKDSVDLAHYLLEKYHIATLPGYAFGVPAGQLSLRIATSFVDMETDEKAEQLLQAWRAEKDPEALVERHLPVTNEALETFTRFVTDLNRMQPPTQP